MSGKLLIAGFAAVAIAAFFLLRHIDTTGATTKPSLEPPKQSTESPVRGPVAAAPESTPNPAATAPTAATSRPAISAPKSIELPKIAEHIVAADEEPPRDEHGKKIGAASLDTLRETSAQTDEPIRECIAKFGGTAVTGTLIVAYTAARSKDRKSVVVESAGHEEEGSSLTDPKLVDCIVQTTWKTKFPFVNSPLPTWARKVIQIDAGFLSRNFVLEHGYVR